jgi:hypothetical protein
LAKFFREGDEAEVKVVYDLARDIVRERFSGEKAVTKRRPTHKPNASAARSRAAVAAAPAAVAQPATGE